MFYNCLVQYSLSYKVEICVTVCWVYAYCYGCLLEQRNITGGQTDFHC